MTANALTQTSWTLHPWRSHWWVVLLTSLVDYPLMMMIAAERTNHLVPCTQSAADNNYNGGHSNQHELGKSQPSLAKAQKRAQMKTPEHPEHPTMSNPITGCSSTIEG